MPPELDIITTAGWSGQLLPSLINMSGPLMAVRSSTGHLRSRHLSRDSGDIFLDTPNSGEDILHPADSGIHGVNASELQSALQGQHNQHQLSRADIALILLAEIAYKNDEDFRENLPLLFHVTCVSSGSSEDIVLQHCQHLLVNLLYSLAGRHLELSGVQNSVGANKQQVVSLIKYIQSKRGSWMWENEDLTLAAVCSCTLHGLMLSFSMGTSVKLGKLKHSSRQWNAHQGILPSHLIYCALKPSVKSDNCVLLPHCLHRCLGNPFPAVLGFAVEILLTKVMVENMEPEKVILYPQLFWGCFAMMHTDYVRIYCQVLELFSMVIDRLSFRDRTTTENVLLSSMPQDELDNNSYDAGQLNQQQSRTGGSQPESGKVPTFEGVQPLVLKGLMSAVSHESAIEVLSHITDGGITQAPLRTYQRRRRRVTSAPLWLWF